MSGLSIMYITSVKFGEMTKHIVEVYGKNVEVTEYKRSALSSHYSKRYLSVNLFNVFEDLSLEHKPSNKSFSVVDAVYELEVARFIWGYLDSKDGTK